MAQSPKKRMEFKKRPTNKKSINKRNKMMKQNYDIINRLFNELN
jgi:hypothetical protein